MKFLKVSILLLSFLNAFNCSDIEEFKKYNGHYYTTTKSKLTFLQAKQLAESEGCYLAIPNDKNENDFLKSLIPTPKYAWIGIYDPQYTSNYCYGGANCLFDDSRFLTIKGGALIYKNWATRQPDNLVKEYDIQNGKQMVSPLGEHWVAISSLDGKWADFGNHFDEYNNPVKHYALIECEKMPECYTPPTEVDETWSGAKCNTKIYDNTSGEVVPGESHNCLKDPNGEYYCPVALAPCRETWSYKDGYSIAYKLNIACPKGTSYSKELNKCVVNTIICPEGEYDEDIKKCVKEVTKINCDGNWHEFGERGFINKGIAGVPKGEIKIWGGKRFVTKLRYKCYSPSSVYLEQLHTYDGKGGWSRVYNGTLNLKAAESNPNYDTGLMRSPAESWADAHYYTPYVDPWYRQQLVRWTYMDGIYARFKRVGNQLYVYIGNTYDGQGWKIRDEVYGYMPIYQKIEYDPICPDGMDVVDNNLCGEAPIVYTYYKYLCSGANEYGEEYEPQDPGGDCKPKSQEDLIDTNGDGVPDSCNSPTPPPNNCKAKSFTCVPAPDRKCVMVDNQWQCSPFPCFGEGKGDYNVTTDDTPVGINDKENDGWNNDGSCSGQLYIFNGKDMRCRSDDAYFGLSGGGCCDKDKVFLGLVQCKDEEKLLAKKNDQKQCHYVGKYCSKKVNLAFTKVCVQHKKTYCCFNSKLARIIQEQGREQLKMSWGDAKHPNCRGFRPEEFQKLDFSKMDLSDYYEDITQNFSQQVADGISSYIKNSVENQIENTKVE